MAIFKKHTPPADTEAQEIWRKYEQGLEHGRLEGRFTNAEKCWRFYEGDQWNGIKNAEGALPFLNIIRPTTDYKKAKLAMNAKTITFTAAEDKKGILKAVNRQVEEAWEFGKMDDRLWEVAEQGLVEGTSFLYFPDSGFFEGGRVLSRCFERSVFAQVLEGTKVFLGDEEERDLQSQPYIIIAERLLTAQIKEKAKKNGISDEDLLRILPDDRSEAEVTTGTKEEQKGAGGYTTGIIYFERTENGIRFCRAVRDLIYQPFQELNMSYYPIVPFAVKRQKGKARGIGEVLPLIPNQIEINSTLLRRSTSVKQHTFPKLVYNKRVIEDASKLDTVGAAIAVDDDMTVGSVQQYVGYVQPSASNGEADRLQNELITVTKELAGAGDATLGNVNPEQASGAAITAVQDQADIPMNREISAFAQMIEDIAILWFHMILANNAVEYKTKEGSFKTAELRKLCPKVQVTVSSALPKTVNAKINEAYQLLTGGLITFEEYMEIVGEHSNISFEKLKESREAAQLKQAKEMDAQMSLEASAAQEEINAAELDSMMAASGQFDGMFGG